jgi:hypothetical protein
MGVRTSGTQSDVSAQNPPTPLQVLSIFSLIKLKAWHQGRTHNTRHGKAGNGKARFRQNSREREKAVKRREEMNVEKCKHGS